MWEEKWRGNEWNMDHSNSKDLREKPRQRGEFHNGASDEQANSLAASKPQMYPIRPLHVNQQRATVLTIWLSHHSLDSVSALSGSQSAETCYAGYWILWVFELLEQILFANRIENGAVVNQSVCWILCCCNKHFSSSLPKTTFLSHPQIRRATFWLKIICGWWVQKFQVDACGPNSSKGNNEVLLQLRASWRWMVFQQDPNVHYQSCRVFPGRGAQFHSVKVLSADRRASYDLFRIPLTNLGLSGRHRKCIYSSSMLPSRAARHWSPKDDWLL